MDSIQFLDNTEVAEVQNLDEVLLKINRCSAVVKGGRRFSFSALSVVGNRKGIVGYGFGKARQVPGAIEKAAKDGRKHLMTVPVTAAGSIRTTSRPSSAARRCASCLRPRAPASSPARRCAPCARWQGSATC